MNKNLKYIVAGSTGLVAAISLGSALSLASKNKTAEAEIIALQEQIVRMEAHVPAPDKEPEIIYMTDSGNTNEVTALKTALAEKEALLTSATNRLQRNRESFEDRMKKMKAEDPEGYAEMIQKRKERQEEMKYKLAERTATFMYLDTSHMTEEELANHELLIEKMAKVWELTDQFNDPEQPPDRKAMRELFNEMREVRPLMNQERSVMFKQLGTDLGYEGDDAQAFASHVEEIIEATSVKMPGGRGGRGR